jgi:predicted MFS family arabinose efflux permease
MKRFPMQDAPPPALPPTPAERRAERLLIAVLCAIQVTHLTDFVILMPLGPQLMRVFTVTPQQFALLVSSYTFSAAVAGVVAALVIDRFGRKRALLWLYAGFTIATLACALAPGYGWLMAARIAAGACGGVLSALVLAVVGDAFPYARRGAATGAVMAGFSIASVAGVPLGLWLAARWSWHAPFYLLTGLSAAVWTMAAVALPPLRGHLQAGPRDAHATTLARLFGDPNHRWAFALTVTLMFAGFSVIPFLSPYLVANVGLGEPQLAYVYLLGGICTVVTSNLIGRCADRFGKAATFTAVAAVSLAPILVVTNLRQAPLATTLLITTVFIIFVSGRFVPAMAMVTAAVDARHRGSFMSINSAIQSLAAGLAAYLAGLIIARPDEHGPLQHFDRVGALAAVATVACMVIVRRVRARG